MFFTLSKIFWFFAEPLSLLVALGVLGVALGFTRFAGTGRALTAGAMIILGIALFTPLGVALIRPLEDRFPEHAADGPPPTGIIVLGGSVFPQLTQARKQVSIEDAATRLTMGVELARRYPGARLVFSGGSGSMTDKLSEASDVRELWLALGVPAAQMSFEGKSRNTWENALFTRELVAPKPGETWLLVTSAWHMPRSVGIFRRVGFDVTPFPVDYHTFGDARDWRLFAPMLERAFMFECGIHEWIGLIAYRLAGKTDALFPAPSQ